MERLNRRWVTSDEYKQIQLRVNELEAENEKLKNKSDLIRELIGLIANNSLPRSNSIKQDGGGSLEQVIELAKDLSNDIRNIMKNSNH